MSQKQVKLLRRQLRNVVQELMPQVLTSVLVESLQKGLSGQIEERLNRIDERQKDLQAYMVRQAPVTPPTTEAAAPTKE